MLKTIKLLLVLFLVIIISSFSLLFVGIKINSFSFGNFSISQFYIKFDKKLIVNVDEIIFKSKKSQVKSSYEDLKKDIELLPKLLKIFEKINVERLIIDGNELSIRLNDESLYLDSKYINLSSKVDFISNQVIFELDSLYLKDINLLLLGKVKVDYFNEKYNYYGNYLYDDISGNIKIDIENQILSAYLNSNLFKSLKFLKKYINLPQIAESWMYDNVNGDIKLKEFYGSYDLKNNKLLTNSLHGKAVIDNALVQFHKDVKAIETKSIDVNYDNDRLSFYLNEPKYMSNSIDGSNVVISNLTSAKNGEVEVNIKVEKAKLDNDIQKILKAFKLNVPLLQNKGETKADLKLIFPYVKEKHMITLGEFDIKNSEILINKFKFNSKSAKVLLKDTKIEIKNADFKYKKMIDATVNLDLDIKTLQSWGKAKINSFYIGNEQNDIIKIKNYNTNLNMDFNKKVFISLKELGTNINISDLIYVDISNLNKLYEYSPILKDNGLKKGNISLKIKDENDLNFQAKILDLDYPIEKESKKIDSLDILGSLKNGNISIVSKDENIKITKNQNQNLKIDLKNLDINLKSNGKNNDIRFPTLDAKLQNSNLILEDSRYFINSAKASLKENKIDFDAKVSKLQLPLQKKGKKIDELELKGSYTKDETSLYTKNNDLNLILKKDDISIDLNGYDVLYNTTEQNDEKYKSFNLTAKNSNIIMNDKYKFISDFFEIRLRENSKFLHLNYKNSDITFKESKDKKIDIFANNINDEFINSIYNKKILVGGNFMLLAKGDINNLDGKLLIENSKVEDLAILNNLLLFIHTSPALINPILAIPSLVGIASSGGLNLTGYDIKNGTIEFNYSKEKELLSITKLLTVGNGMDFDGVGKIDLKDMSINSKIKLIFLKDYSSIVGAIPILNYILLGKDKRVETEVDLFGPLNNPKISTNLTKDTFSVPLNIAKRILQSPSELIDFIKEENKIETNELLNKPKD